MNEKLLYTGNITNTAWSAFSASGPRLERGISRLQSNLHVSS